MQTILLVAIGRITDIIGRVRLFNAGFAIFTIGSALCAISPNAELLVLFRLIQGLGGAFLLGNCAAIVTDSFPAPERVRTTYLSCYCSNCSQGEMVEREESLADLQRRM